MAAAREVQEAQQHLSMCLTARAQAQGLLGKLKEELDQIEAAIVDQTQRIKITEQQIVAARENAARVQAEQTLESRLAKAREVRTEALRSAQENAALAAQAVTTAKQRQIEAEERFATLASAVPTEGAKP